MRANFTDSVEQVFYNSITNEFTKAAFTIASVNIRLFYRSLIKI